MTREKALSDDSEVGIGGNVSNSVVVNGDQNVVNVSPQQEKPKTKARRRSKPKKRPKPNIPNPLILVALITLAGTIITAILTSPLIKDLLISTPLPSSTPTIQATDTPQSVVPVGLPQVMDTPTITLTFTPTLESTFTPSPSPEPVVDKMTAVLTPNLYEGKAPFRINFDARSSYVQFTDGRVVACGNMNLCSYVFTIYRAGTLVDTISNGNGILSYVFGAKGKYTVTVSVCRGGACSFSAVEVNIR